MIVLMFYKEIKGSEKEKKGCEGVSAIQYVVLSILLQGTYNVKEFKISKYLH